MVVVFGYGESWVGRAIMVVCHDAKVMVVCVPMGFLVRVVEGMC